MDGNQSGNSNGSLYFIVGGLVVAVGIGAFLYYSGHVNIPGRATTTERTTTAPTPAGSTTTTTTTDKAKP